MDDHPGAPHGAHRRRESTPTRSDGRGRRLMNTLRQLVRIRGSNDTAEAAQLSAEVERDSPRPAMRDGTSGRRERMRNTLRRLVGSRGRTNAGEASPLSGDAQQNALPSRGRSDGGRQQGPIAQGNYSALNLPARENPPPYCHSNTSISKEGDRYPANSTSSDAASHHSPRVAEKRDSLPGYSSAPVSPVADGFYPDVPGREHPSIPPSPTNSAAASHHSLPSEYSSISFSPTGSAAADEQTDQWERDSAARQNLASRPPSRDSRGR
jgi:hypothetical protein